MGILVRLTVPAPDDILRDYGAGALLRVERAATEAGAYAEITTTPVATNTFSYEVWDATGVTTSWYRTRYSTSAGATPSDYSDPFSPGSPEAYATLDQMLLHHRQGVTDTKTLARYESALREATRDLNREMGGRDFFRHPASGTETRIYHGTGRDILHVHEGIVTLSQVEIRLTFGGDWVIVPAADWWLEGAPGNPNPAPGEPYFHVRLSPMGAYKVFPAIQNGVRLTLAWGWPEVLPDATEAVVAWARQKVGWDPTNPGGPPGPEDLRGMPAGDRMPDAVYRLLVSERHRHWCHI